MGHINSLLIIYDGNVFSKILRSSRDGELRGMVLTYGVPGTIVYLIEDVNYAVIREIWESPYRWDLNLGSA